MGNDSSNVLGQNDFFVANGVAGTVGDNDDVSASVAGAVNNLGNLTDNDMDVVVYACLLYTSPSPRDRTRSRMPSSA